MEQTAENIIGNPFPNAQAFIYDLDKRLTVTENNYENIDSRLEKLDVKIDDLTVIIIEKKMQKQIREKIKSFIYNGSMLVLGIIGIYDILFKFFGIK